VREQGSRRFRRIESNLPGTRRSYRFNATAGRSYEFRARAVDGSGRAGPWDGARSIVPFDAFVRLPNYADGWELARTRGAYGGRVARSTREGDELRLAFKGRRLYLIGRRSPRGGRAVALLGRERRVLDFQAARTQERAVIAVWRLPRGGRHELHVANLGGGRVEIDAFGIARR
jgi:hypothetical protein